MYSRRSVLHLFGASAIVALGESHQPRKRNVMTISTANPVRATVQVNGVNAGDPSTIIVDGSATTITANGLAGYLPVTGDRLLVQAVGEQVEVIQFLSKGLIVGQTIKTSPSGQRWEITSGTTPGNPNSIMGFTGGANETTPGFLADFYTAGGGTHDTATIALLAPRVGGQLGAGIAVTSGQTAADGSIQVTTGGTGPIQLQSPTEIGVNGAPIKGMTFGAVNVTATASATGSIVVNHGLGVAPTAILVSVAGTAQWFATTTSTTSTQFTLNISHRDGTAATATLPCSWIAIV